MGPAGPAGFDDLLSGFSTEGGGVETFTNPNPVEDQKTAQEAQTGAQRATTDPSGLPYYNKIQHYMRKGIVERNGIGYWESTGEPVYRRR